MLVGIMRSYEDGDVIFRQGDPAADMYVVRAGAVRITRTREEGESVLAVLEEGESFGEMGLFAPGARSATATAVGSTRVEAIDVGSFKSAVPEPIVWKLLSRMSERIRRADESLDDAASGAPII